MKCHQCDRAALILANGGNVPLCLDCWNKLNVTLAMQNEQLERLMNFAVDSMDETLGLPPSGPRFPARKPPVHIAGVTLHNIIVDNSSVGVLNTGSIASLDASITIIRDAGNKDLAQAIQELSSAFASAKDIPDSERREAIEILSTVSSEASAPKEAQKPMVAKVLLGRLGELAKVGNAVSGLWERWGPVLIAAFGQA